MMLKKKNERKKKIANIRKKKEIENEREKLRIIGRRRREEIRGKWRRFRRMSYCWGFLPMIRDI